MGWIIVIAVGPLVRNLPLGGILWLVAGGLSYTGGAFFYAMDRKPFFHAVWHGFVLAGSVFHFMAVLLYVIPW